MQNTLEIETVAPAQTKRRSRARVAIVSFMGMFLALFSAGVSFADTTPTTTDPLDGGGDQIFTTLTAYLQTHLVSLVLGLAAVSIALSLVVKWVRKAVHG